MPATIIYFNDKPLYLVDTVDARINEYLQQDNVVIAKELNAETLKYVIGEMQRVKTSSGVFLHNNVEVLKQAILNEIPVITAAGGVVFNEQNELLFIFRRGKWDLPKGKLDENESIESCAVREVSEETGLKKIDTATFLTTTYHTYYEGAKLLLKETHWYKMIADGTQSVTPQIEEDILEINWVAKEKLAPYLQNTYPSIRDVINRLL